ncbi:hypothetical protein VPH35_089827 [Triticum aestivum]
MLSTWRLCVLVFTCRSSVWCGELLQFRAALADGAPPHLRHPFNLLQGRRALIHLVASVPPQSRSGSSSSLAVGRASSSLVSSFSLSHQIGESLVNTPPGGVLWQACLQCSLAASTLAV